MVRAGHVGGDVFIIISCRDLMRVSSSAAECVWTFVPFSTFLRALKTLSNWDVLVIRFPVNTEILKNRDRKWTFQKKRKLNSRITTLITDIEQSHLSSVGKDYYGLTIWLILIFYSQNYSKGFLNPCHITQSRFHLYCGLLLRRESPGRCRAPLTPIWNVKDWSLGKASINTSHLLPSDNLQAMCI